jgi:hypothetical protein
VAAGASVEAGASVAAEVLSDSLVAGDSTAGVAAGPQAESITAIKRMIPIKLKVVLRNMFFLLVYSERIEASHNAEGHRRMTTFLFTSLSSQR